MADPRPAGIMGATVLVMAVVAGCTSTQPGSATVSPPGTGASAQPGPADGGSQIALPPRPSDVPVAGVDPCSLLTGAQQAQLGVLAGKPGLPAQLADNSPTCNFRFADGTPGAEYNVAVDTTEGIQLYLNPSLAADVRQVSVGDFPALDVTLKAPDLLQGCTTAVSVANGQMFLVNLGQPARGTTTAQSCALTEKVAGAVLTTVRNRGK